MAAKWIGLHSDNRIGSREIYFRKDISLEKLETCQLQILASDRYKLYINGRLTEIGPQRSSQKMRYIDTVDVTDFLKVGLNQIGVIVLTYPESSGNRMFSLIGSGQAGLYLHSDTHPELNSDATWSVYENQKVQLVSESPVFAPLQLYEKRSGNRDLKDWCLRSVSELNWPTATEIKFEDQRYLIERTIPFLYRKARRFKSILVVRESTQDKEAWQDWLTGKTPFLTLPAKSRHMVELDAGEEMTGFLKLQVANGTKSQMRILQSEGYALPERTMVNGLDIPVKGNRLDFENGHLEGFQDDYHVAGFGSQEHPETVEPYWFRTFRFIRLEIEVVEEDLLLGSFDYEETGYPLQVQTQIETSDESLSKIWELSERTLRRCMHETYEDCPFYEQLQYVMDTRAQALYTYTVSADDRLARQAMDYFKDSQFQSGLLNGAAPSHADNIIPTFSIFYILMVLDHSQYFGDKSLVERHFSTIQKVLAYFSNHIGPRGLVERIGTENGKSPHWSFIDWTKEWQESSGVPIVADGDEITLESLLYLMGLEAAKELALVMDDGLAYATWKQSAIKLKKSLISQTMDSQGFLKDGPTTNRYSQHAQVFGILTGLVSPEEGRKILLTTVERPEQFAQCSVAMSLYLFQALAKVNLYELSDHYWDIWRAMLAKNLTTSIEAVDGERSDCHAWGAVALYVLPTYTLGIQPLDPGFNRILISPKIGHLSWAKGSVITPKGLVSVSWKRTADGLDLTYQAPEGVQVIVEKN